MGCEFDIIIPVPMYAAKEKERGYNQAALLGEFLGRRAGAECRCDCLLRVRPTVPMSRLNARQRRENLDGAFLVSRTGKRVLPGKRVLLVDDLYTTGTTVEHCSFLLKACGAAEVTVATVASGRNQRRLPEGAADAEAESEF